MEGRLGRKEGWGSRRVQESELGVEYDQYICV